MTRPLLVVGQSHVAAVRDAARARREADPERPRTRVIHTAEPRYAPELQDDRLSPALEAEIRDQIARHAPTVVSVIGGNRHNAFGLIRHPRPWDVRLADDDPLDPAAEPIPLATVRAVLAREIEGDLHRLRLLADLAPGLVHLESPPPLADDARVQRLADAFFRDAGIARLGVAPAALRLKLWRLHSTLVAEACAALGVRVLPVPAAVQDAAGFLRADLAADATHGNARYGEAMIAHIEAQTA